MTALHAQHTDSAAVTRRVVDLSNSIAESAATSQELMTIALRLTCELVPGARWASLTKLGKHPSTIAASDERASDLDELQYRGGAGPCLTAIEDRTVIVSDFATEERWPEFIAQAGTGCTARASLSISLAAGGHADTSLNLYSDGTDARHGAELDAAMLAAAGLAVLLTAIAHREKMHNLEVALTSSRVIGAAIGILMTRHGWTYDQAFDALRRISQHHHRKLRDIADDVVLTGALPT